VNGRGRRGELENQKGEIAELREGKGGEKGREIRFKFHSKRSGNGGQRTRRGRGSGYVQPSLERTRSTLLYSGKGIARAAQLLNVRLAR
jgi:hypothetical protein